MSTSYVKQENRKRKYSTRAVTYYIQRITEPMDDKPRAYRSIARLAEETNVPENTVRTFAKSQKESQYIYSKDGLVLYILRRPERDVAITARSAEYEDESQTFTSEYQLVRRFRVSFSTVSKLKKMQPRGEECKKTINDEFKRPWYVTFWK